MIMIKRFSWIVWLVLEVIRMRRKSIALTATLRSFLISSPQLTPKKGVTAVLKNATRVHDVVV